MKHCFGGRYAALAGGIVCVLVSIESSARADAKNACITDCSGAPLSEEARTTVATRVEPTLQSIRSCLAAIGGENIRPIVIANVDSFGNAQIIRIDAGGYEKLACMPKAVGLQGATSMRCELRCDGTAPPPPVVVGPAATPGDTPTSIPSGEGPAKTTPSTPTTPRSQQEIWYGWQTLLADGAALGTWIAAGFADSSAVSGVGTGIYLLGPPVIHFVHGRVGPGFGSFGIRLLAPPVGAGIGALTGLAIGGSSGEFGTTLGGLFLGFLIGAFVGWGTAVAIDAAVLSYEKVEPNDKTATLKKPQALRLLPSLVLTPTPQGGFVGAGGLTGTF